MTPELYADLSQYGVDIEPDPLDAIDDDALACFVRWCRTNGPVITADVRIARRVLSAYTQAGKP